MQDIRSVKERERLLYKKCCNYACECSSDELRRILGDAANQTRLRLGEEADELKND